MSIEPLDPDVVAPPSESVVVEAADDPSTARQPRRGPARCEPLLGDRRRGLIVVLLALGGLAIGVRLVQLQVIEHARLAARGTRQKSYVEILPAPPGDLLDRDGRVLATSVVTRSLFVVPEKITDPWPCAQRLARVLHVDPDRVCERLAQQSEKKFAWIKRRVTPEEEQAVAALGLPVGAWGLREEYARRYPQGTLAAHVLGLRDVDGNSRGGLEQALGEAVRGRPGRRTLYRDARGRVIDVPDDTDIPPQPGQSVVTSLDSIIQLYAERELDRIVEEWKPRGACALVEDPSTGEILAMASRPTFDPNRPEGVSDDAWINRAIAWMYEPGSTFKPFVVAGAIERGRIRPDEEVDCAGGETRLASRLLHDTHPYGLLSVADVLVKSSNIGMSRIAAKLSNKELFATIATFGFGRVPGSGLPGEIAGLLRPVKEWSSYSNASLSIGQELAVTPLQMISAQAALANGGTLISPKVVLRTLRPGADDETRLPLATSVVSRAADHATTRWLIEGPMRDVVLRGTGTRANLPGYSVFGKTGTAQKLDHETRAYSADKYVSSFLCGAPAAAPRVIVLVVVDEPSVGGSHYGGTVAAPAAAEILRQTLAHLHVAPDESHGEPHDVTAARPVP
ncbi:MAG TPA: penicillin-binding protein 2 [Planctomycetaceae bacterium]|jgi:cell division protein FtsI/penicillin-binding protein 2|nr:penicillin-binding protein 2 [Planctomycetaceae bacterium]